MKSLGRAARLGLLGRRLLGRLGAHSQAARRLKQLDLGPRRTERMITCELQDLLKPMCLTTSNLRKEKLHESCSIKLSLPEICSWPFDK